MKIMVVEDDKNINEVVSEFLKDAGFLVLSVNDGREAQNIIEEEEDLDLFILDIMLPNVSGLEILQALRQKDIYKKTPVIMLTALQDEYTQLISFEGLADDYVTKPFSPKILVKRVEAILRRAGQFVHGIEAGPISINIDSYEAFVNKKRISLTFREFELLKMFMQNQMKALSRQQLLNTVWGYDYFGDERIVDVHIKNLRKKLQIPVIDTVKGVGYKFVAPREGRCYEI